MKKHPLYLQIAEPCQEDWEEMQARPEGKFCQHCQKTVVDFSEMSDSQIVEFIQANPSKTCGRFLSSQLHRPLRMQLKPATTVRRLHYLSPLVGGVLLFASVQNAFSQTPISPKTEQTQNSNSNPTQPPKDGEPEVHEVVFQVFLAEHYSRNSNDTFPIAKHAAVFICEFGEGYYSYTLLGEYATDQQGMVKIKLKKEWADRNIIAIFDQEGYMQKQFSVKEREDSPIKVILNSSRYVMGGMGGYYPDPKNEDGIRTPYRRK